MEILKKTPLKKTSLSRNITIRYVMVAILLGCSGIGYSQTVIGNKIVNPNINAVLELSNRDNNKGLLMPKVELKAINSPAPLSKHVSGITVYNTVTAGSLPNQVTPGFYYNDGTGWKKIGINEAFAGDIKHSALTVDHDGWYLLNGRVKTTLPLVARNNATSLGFENNLPDAGNLFLKAKKDNEVLGSIGGSHTFSVVQANLPVITFTGQTAVAGRHAHVYGDTGRGDALEGAAFADPRYIAGTGKTTKETGSNGAHTHPFSGTSDGSGNPITFIPSYTTTNIFIYLGQ